ncbi:hypothetical protein [Streptomyces sp. NPDC058695]|uniref:hypothetical protein n=1 Tax=Streptomyces sp. NPDC058695 TaxID=3346604 RepID=UPI00366A2CF3
MAYVLEVAIVPVSDVDRCSAFCAERLGFNLDVDRAPRPDFRVVQLTPSRLRACSVPIEWVSPKPSLAR